MAAHREHREFPSFARQLETRIATIGMYATVYLLEDAYDFELPRAFHADPTVRALKRLANQIVGLGNDILSFGKDYAEDQLNLITTLMSERGLSVDVALEHLVRMHDESLEEHDRLADTLGGWPLPDAPFIARWVEDVRYASLGFSLWESQAPRYTAFKVVASGRVLEPKFSFFPPQRSDPPSSRRRLGPPSSRRAPPPSSRRHAPRREGS